MFALQHLSFILSSMFLCCAVLHGVSGKNEVIRISNQQDFGHERPSDIKTGGHSNVLHLKNDNINTGKVTQAFTASTNRHNRHRRQSENDDLDPDEAVIDLGPGKAKVKGMTNGEAVIDLGPGKAKVKGITNGKVKPAVMSEMELNEIPPIKQATNTTFQPDLNVGVANELDDDEDDEDNLPAEFLRDASNLERSVLALTGHKAILPCDRSAADLDLTDMTFKWQDSHGRPITHSREEVQDNGALVISDAQPEDSGTYICQVSNKAGETRSKAKPHHLLVYQLPAFAYHFTYVYHVTSCESLEIQKKVDYIRDSLCTSGGAICPFHVSHKCHARTGRFSARHSGMEEELVVIVKQKVGTDFDVPDCDVLCMKQAVMKHLSERFSVAKQLSVSEQASPSPHMRFEPHGFSKTNHHECPGGYRDYRATLCIPCHPGTFSPDDVMTCLTCRKNMYQDHYASTACIPCPKNGTTQDKGAANLDQCTAADVVMKVKVELTEEEARKDAMYAGVVMAIILPLLVAVGVYGYCMKKKKGKIMPIKPGWLPPWMRKAMNNPPSVGPSPVPEELPLLGNLSTNDILEHSSMPLLVEEGMVQPHTQMITSPVPRISHNQMVHSSHTHHVNQDHVTLDIPTPVPAPRLSQQSISRSRDVSQSTHQVAPLVEVHSDPQQNRQTSMNFNANQNPGVTESDIRLLTGGSAPYSLQDIEDVLGSKSSQAKNINYNHRAPSGVYNNQTPHGESPAGQLYHPRNMNNNMPSYTQQLMEKALYGSHVGSERQKLGQANDLLYKGHKVSHKGHQAISGLGRRVSSTSVRSIPLPISGLSSLTSLFKSSQQESKKSSQQNAHHKSRRDEWVRRWQKKNVSASNMESSSSESETTSVTHTTTTSGTTSQTSGTTCRQSGKSSLPSKQSSENRKHGTKYKGSKHKSK